MVVNHWCLELQPTTSRWCKKGSVMQQKMGLRFWTASFRKRWMKEDCNFAHVLRKWLLLHKTIPQEAQFLKSNQNLRFHPTRAMVFCCLIKQDAKFHPSRQGFLLNHAKTGKNDFLLIGLKHISTQVNLTWHFHMFSTLVDDHHQQHCVIRAQNVRNSCAIQMKELISRTDPHGQLDVDKVQPESKPPAAFCKMRSAKSHILVWRWTWWTADNTFQDEVQKFNSEETDSLHRSSSAQ